jgi:serine/threonine protein kinase
MMQTPFQVDKFHFNNHQGATVIGDRLSGFSLTDQSKVFAIVLNEAVLTEEQLQELQRVTLILAQQEHAGVSRPLAWGTIEGRHYVVFPDFGRALGSFEHLKALPPAELLLFLRQTLKALCFADSKGIQSHQSIRPDTIRISLEEGMAKLSFFGYPMVELAEILKPTEDAPWLLKYFPPAALSALEQAPYQLDIYALGLLALELATSKPIETLVSEADLLNVEELRARLTAQPLPLPIQELLYKMLTPMVEERYQSFQQALDDVVQLAGMEETGLRFQTFILDTMVNGRFQLGEEISRGRISRLYAAIDSHQEADANSCVVKLTDLRAHPELSGAFNTRFKQLMTLRHEHLMEVYDVGIHFENGFVAMEAGLQSLEQLLIKRGTLPLNDAGRVIFQICKALEGLHFNQVFYHGAIKPSNVFQRVYHQRSAHREAGRHADG